MERLSKEKQIKPTTADAGRETNTIVFFHPDLGIGGAERLIIDAAVGLQGLGHKIIIYTSHCDPGHCFDEARDGTLEVRVRGDRIFPATFLGRFRILCSILRQINLLCAITWSGELSKLKPSAFFVDQLSAGIPFLRWFFEDTRILFYCHFPDLLLVQGRKNWYKRIWRLGFDWVEGWGIRGADRVIVNSGFTKSVVERVWPGLGGRERGVGVVYPCVDTEETAEGVPVGDEREEMWKGKRVLLSINRFESKKNIDLAIKAFAGLKAKDREGTRLVIAGGYDTRLQENVSYHKHLELLAASLKLKTATVKNLVTAQAIPNSIDVLFLLSVPDQLKTSLLKAAKLLLYTPSDEHFGIVPLEAMLAGVPVLASNSGGPLETVIDPVTGWLRSVDHPFQWTEVIHQVLYQLSAEQLKEIGDNGRQHVREEFSKNKMARTLDQEISVMIKSARQQATELGDLGVAALLFTASLAAVSLVFREALRTDLPGLVNKPIDAALGASIIIVASIVVMMVVWKLKQNESAFT